MSRFGDLIRGTSKKSTEDTTSKPSVSEVVESPIIDEDTTNYEYAVEEDVKTFPYESSEVVESPIIDEDTTNYEYAVEEDVKTFPYESSEVVESPIIDEDTTNYEYAVEEDVKTFPYESDVSLHDMTKNELEEYGRTVGIELDKRRSKKRLIEDLENYLCQ